MQAPQLAGRSFQRANVGRFKKAGMPRHSPREPEKPVVRVRRMFLEVAYQPAPVSQLIDNERARPTGAVERARDHADNEAPRRERQRAGRQDKSRWQRRACRRPKFGGPVRLRCKPCFPAVPLADAHAAAHEVGMCGQLAPDRRLRDEMRCNDTFHHLCLTPCARDNESP